MKTVVFQPIRQTQQVDTGTDLLQALLASRLNVMMACRGKGLCATCHVRIRDGGDKLTVMTEREKRTLSRITGSGDNSRLACQCRVLGDGIQVELPEGMYIGRAEDLMSMLGTRASENILHPINGSILIAKGKLITRSRLEELKNLGAAVEQLQEQQ